MPKEKQRRQNVLFPPQFTLGSIRRTANVIRNGGRRKITRRKFLDEVW